MISLFVIGFTIRKSKDLSPIKKSGVRAPATAPFPELNQGSKERDVAVDSKWAEQRGPRQREAKGKGMGATTPHARACARQG
ncbi:hypothetical protein [Burkholderia ambifaria]|uniref:hypothetical protein n=1 Tax=Burkholderia ambifaria TaxID=152480 RepID=UPI00158ABD3C|nr:hypothetical protein [Burkholderia ambifaria]